MKVTDVGIFAHIILHTSKHELYKLHSLSDKLANTTVTNFQINFKSLMINYRSNYEHRHIEFTAVNVQERLQKSPWIL